MRTGSSQASIITFHKILSYLVATVWLINGLFCKVLNMVPRHQEIVARILGGDYASLFTKLIGISEVLMAIWIISRIKRSLCAVTQILIILLMNIIEFYSAADLLLFGRINLLVALSFCTLIYYNEFIIYRKIQAAK